MGYALGNLCELNANDNFDLKKSDQQCRRSILFETAALKLSPDNVEVKTALANRYGWLADVLVKQKQYSEARKARRAEQILVNQLVSTDPKNFELRNRQIWPQIGLAQIMIAEGRKAEGAQILASIERKYAALSGEAPGNIEIEKARLRAVYYRAETLAGVDPTQARRALNQVRSLLEDMRKRPDQAALLKGYLDGMKQIEESLAGGKNDI
jgi:predicted negative regulator of RcsB-dependent stress response